MSENPINRLPTVTDSPEAPKTCRCVADVITEIVDRRVNENRKRWEKAGCNNDLRRDIVIGLEETALRNRLRTMVASGHITPRNPNDGTPLYGINDCGGDLSWHLSASDLREFSELSVSVALNIPPTLDDIAAHVAERRDRYAKQDTDREAAGRYTMEEAASLIALNTDEREGAALGLLLLAVKEGTLTVHEPGRDLPYRPATVRKFYEEAYWNDLNAWLNGILFRNPWRFPNPQKSEVRRESLAVKHEQAILSAIGALKLKPTGLERGTPGKPGAKAEIKAYLGGSLTHSQFENAWGRLRAAKTIRYADEPLS